MEIVSELYTIKLPDQFNFHLHHFNIILLRTAVRHCVVCLIGTAAFGKKWHHVPLRHSCLCSQAMLRYISIPTAMKPQTQIRY